MWSKVWCDGSSELRQCFESFVCFAKRSDWRRTAADDRTKEGLSGEKMMLWNGNGRELALKIYQSMWMTSSRERRWRSQTRLVLSGLLLILFSHRCLSCEAAANNPVDSADLPMRTRQFGEIACYGQGVTGMDLIGLSQDAERGDGEAR